MGNNTAVILGGAVLAYFLLRNKAQAAAPAPADGQGVSLDEGGGMSWGGIPISSGGSGGGVQNWDGRFSDIPDDYDLPPPPANVPTPTPIPPSNAAPTPTPNQSGACIKTYGDEFLDPTIGWYVREVDPGCGGRPYMQYMRPAPRAELPPPPPASVPTPAPTPAPAPIPAPVPPPPPAAPVGLQPYMAQGLPLAPARSTNQGMSNYSPTTQQQNFQPVTVNNQQASVGPVGGSFMSPTTNIYVPITNSPTITSANANRNDTSQNQSSGGGGAFRAPAAAPRPSDALVNHMLANPQQYLYTDYERYGLPIPANARRPGQSTAPWA